MVEPKPGAAGTLAAAQIARATPDGYTLGCIPSGHAVTAATYKSLPYHPIDDFTIIGQAIEFPFVIVTHPEHPIRNMPDLIKTAKARSRAAALRRAGPGNAAASADRIFLAARRHQDPGRCRSAAATRRSPNCSASGIDFLIDPPIALIGQIKSGALHAIGVTGGKRFRAAAGCRHHRRGGLSRLLRHLVDGRGRTGQAAGRRSRRGSTGRSTRWSPSPRWTSASSALGSEPKARHAGQDFKSKRIAADIARWTKVIADAGIEQI